MTRSERLGARIFTALFLLFLAIFSVCNVWHARKDLARALESFHPLQLAQGVERLNETAEENVLGRYNWLEAYGVVQAALGKHEENGFEVVKDKAGYLYVGNFWQNFGDDAREMARRLRLMSDDLATRGTKVGCILPPMKTVRPEQRYAGIPYNDYSKQAETLRRWLDYYGVPCLDLTQLQAASGLSYEEFWFKTDHHWTPPAAFAAYQTVVGWMNETFDAGLDTDGYYRNLDNYDVTLYPKAMLGHFGREAGLVYAGGMEDYSAVIPKEDGRQYVWESDTEILEQGTFQEAFLHTDIAGRSPYKLNAGRFYLEEATKFAYLTNKSLPEGASVLLLRDSFASPLGAFLAQNCAHVDMLWTLEFDEKNELEPYLTQKQYDYVFVMLIPDNLTLDNFHFYEDVSTGEGGLSA